ncbi:hypothetical protein IAE22_32225, partial [Bacillus sp. S34]|nr:hypothetical protein [Bacillus sp. S34]
LYFRYGAMNSGKSTGLLQAAYNYEERGHYVMYPGSDKLDTSILLHAMSAFDRGPRMESTIRAIEDQLQRGPLVYRYSGIEDEESPFLACSFWLVEQYAASGRTEDAREVMTKIVPRDTVNTSREE